MPLTRVSDFTVHKISILNEKGVHDKELEPDLNDKQLLKMYELMVTAREFDEKAVILQRQGRIGTYAPLKGQEACQVGSAICLNPRDWVFPSFREHAVFITRGIPLHALLLYSMGLEEGAAPKKGSHNFSPSIPVGSHMLHAVGVGMAANIKNETLATITYFGDGATSEGDFHEAMNFAGVFNTPVIFLCQNNQWAISVPRKRQTKSDSIAQKAIAYGFEGLQVDGNDVLAVYVATKAALDKAYDGGGPTLIEAVTYRMSMHTTADDPKKYRSEEEVKKWEERDPIKRFEVYLEQKGLWSKDYALKTKDNAKSIIEDEIKKAEEIASKSDPLEMFKHVFEKMPLELEKQMSYLSSYMEEK